MIFSPFLWGFSFGSTKFYHKNGEKSLIKKLKTYIISGFWSLAID